MPIAKLCTAGATARMLDPSLSVCELGVARLDLGIGRQGLLGRERVRGAPD
jgi:hypothetical protein